MEFALICNSYSFEFIQLFSWWKKQKKACEHEKNVEWNEHTTAHQKKNEKREKKNYLETSVLCVWPKWWVRWYWMSSHRNFESVWICEPVHLLYKWQNAIHTNTTHKHKCTWETKKSTTHTYSCSVSSWATTLCVISLWCRYKWYLHVYVCVSCTKVRVCM